MSTDEKKATTNNINEAFAGMTADQIKTELNVVDEIYESLLSKDIEIASETEPEDFAIMLDDEDDMDGNEEDDGIVVNESGEIDIEATLPKGIAVDDPVRMYLKEIGKVPLLSAEDEIELAQRMEKSFVKPT